MDCPKPGSLMQQSVLMRVGSTADIAAALYEQLDRRCLAKINRGV